MSIVRSISLGGVGLLALWLIVTQMNRNGTPDVAESSATTDPPIPTHTTYVHASMAGFPADAVGTDIEAGQHLFVAACAACHNQNATGIDGIGVDLTRSTFVATLTPVQLTTFLKMGLSINSPFNLSNIRMPPQGGRSDLSDEDLLNIASYLKSINTAEGMRSERALAYLDWLSHGGTEQLAATPEVSKIGLTGAALDGQITYLRYCAVCHGPHAEGVQSLGQGFRDNDLIPAISDDRLKMLIRAGLPADHERNHTGIEMLPYGGQPSLTDAEMATLVAYMRAISGQTAPTTIVAEAPTEASTETTVQAITPTISSGAPTEAAANTVAPNAGANALAILDNTSPSCFTCHRIGDRGNKNGPGNDLNGLKDRAGQRVPGLDARAYVEQALLDPGGFVVEECPRGACLDVMPDYEGKFTDEELETVITFLLNLEGE